MTPNSMARSPNEVLDDHLQQGKYGTVEDDLPRNYAEDVVLLTSFGVHHGHAGVRHLATLLRKQLPKARFYYNQVQVDGEFAFLEWTAEAENGVTVEDGADSYVIRDGRIVAHTMHYRLTRPEY